MWFSVCTWNSAVLFGGRTTGLERSAAKRRFLGDLLERHPLVVLQETRGLSADVLHLPGSHVYFNFVGPLSNNGFTTMSGGVLIAVARWLYDRAERAVHTVIVAGRAHMLSLRLPDGWVSLVNIHVDPSLSAERKRRLLNEVARAARGGDGVVFGVTFPWRGRGGSRQMVRMPSCTSRCRNTLTTSSPHGPSFGSLSSHGGDWLGMPAVGRYSAGSTGSSAMSTLEMCSGCTRQSLLQGA